MNGRTQLKQMKIKRTTEILVETERRYVVHQPDHIDRVFCSICDEFMLTAEQAAVVLDLSHRTVYQQVESGTAHFVETETGALFVCPNSLADLVSVKKTIAGKVL